MADRCSFCGSTAGPFNKVGSLFTVLMCADCQAARGHGSGPYPVMTRAEMRAGLDLPPTWALEQKAAANRQVVAGMRTRLAAASRWLACTRAGAGLAGAASRGGRRAGSSTEASNREPPRILTAWVGRLELHFACLHHPRSGGHRPSDLGFRRISSDRSCPLLSVTFPSAADRARTRGS
jgi:hypothetical protein